MLSGKLGKSKGLIPIISRKVRKEAAYAKSFFNDVKNAIGCAVASPRSPRETKNYLTQSAQRSSVRKEYNPPRLLPLRVRREKQKTK